MNLFSGIFSTFDFKKQKLDDVKLEQHTDKFTDLLRAVPFQHFI